MSRTLNQLKRAILAPALLFNYSAMTCTLGLALTRSDTSSNALFGLESLVLLVGTNHLLYPVARVRGIGRDAPG